MTSVMRTGSAEWYEAHPDAPTRAEAEEDAALDRRYPTTYVPGPLTDALDRALNDPTIKEMP